ARGRIQGQRRRRARKPRPAPRRGAPEAGTGDGGPGRRRRLDGRRSARRPTRHRPALRAFVASRGARGCGRDGDRHRPRRVHGTRPYGRRRASRGRPRYRHESVARSGRMGGGRPHPRPAMSGRTKDGAATKAGARSRPIQAWIDLVSPSHPFFFHALARGLDDVAVMTTVREKTETVSLASEVGFSHRVVGRDFDNVLLRKVGIPLRTAQLALEAPDCDVSLSSRNAMCVLASKARGIPSIHFTDNDITAHIDGLWIEELYNRFEAAATHNVVPQAFETSELTRWGARSGAVHTYDGYKEDVYVADFEPDPNFPDRLPFGSGEYIVVRPEALTAAYVNADSIVPDLLAAAAERGIGVVYLPRGRGDEIHA